MYKGRKNVHHFHDTIDVLIKHTFKTVKKKQKEKRKRSNFNFKF